MKIGTALVMTAMVALAACKGSGNDTNNSMGVSGLSANNSAFRGGAAAPSVGNATTNTGTGVTGGNGATTVTAKGLSSSSPKSGANANNSGTGPSAPGTR